MIQAIITSIKLLLRRAACTEQSEVFDYANPLSNILKH